MHQGVQLPEEQTRVRVHVLANEGRQELRFVFVNKEGENSSTLNLTVKGERHFCHLA